MRWIFFISFGVPILLAGIILQSSKSEPKLALSFLDRKLSCGNALDGPLGGMTVTSGDRGMTLQADSGDQKITLQYDSVGLFEETYKNASGQSLDFDGELKFTGFFGGHYGSCD